MKSVLAELRIALVATLALGVLLCGAYPVLVWALAQGLFPQQANGSLITAQGATVGSDLIGQHFAGPRYFHPRPSAAGEAGYDATHSGGANLGPTSRKLVDAVRERTEAYRSENALPPSALVPADAVTSSASGLDPHIGVENARLQAGRVARARGLDAAAILEEVAAHIEGRSLWILGEPRVNVLTLNLALDRRQRMQPRTGPPP
jgi:K+-transporting ATPase ATPase C chain